MPQNSGPAPTLNLIGGTSFGELIAVTGENVADPTDTGAAVNGVGVKGTSLAGTGVSGVSSSGDGIYGTSTSGDGVHGESASAQGSAVAGINSAGGHGVYGTSASGHGVRGINGPGTGGTPASNSGVWGDSSGSYGVLGTSTTSDGVHGSSTSGNGVSGEAAAPGLSAVAGIHSGNGHGVYGRSATGFAGYFDGNVNVTGDVTLGGADCAEEFDSAAGLEPGTVAVLDDNSCLSACTRDYDQRVVGVISGAGAFRPAIVLDRRLTTRPRAPIALIGKVYCKVDASYGPISVGDLLTTSATSGHARRASDPLQAFGAVIGKALAGYDDGRGLIPILVRMQ
jgi:hypothetical protein